MKKIFALTSLALCFTLCSVCVAKPQSTSKQVSFEQSRLWDKVGSNLQKLWTASKASDELDQDIQCFVRIRAPFDMGDKAFLASNGFFTLQDEGIVLKGHMKLGDLPNVAKLPFVQKITLATK